MQDKPKLESNLKKHGRSKKKKKSKIKRKLEKYL
jgi:hypothetical protein